MVVAPILKDAPEQWLCSAVDLNRQSVWRIAIGLCSNIGSDKDGELFLWSGIKYSLTALFSNSMVFP